MTVASGRRPDAGTLVPQQQRDGLELRADGRGHPAAPGSRLDLTNGSGEHRDDIAAVVDASLLPRGATASARLALAWSSHRLLLWVPGHGGHGSMPHSPAAGARNPEQRALCFGRRADCGSLTINAGGLRQAVHTNLSRQWMGR